MCGKNILISKCLPGPWMHFPHLSSWGPDCQAQRQEPELVASFEKPCQGFLALCRELHSSFGSQPFIVWSTLQPWPCLAVSCLEPDPLTWLQLDLGPASWLWMGLAATGLLTDSSYHQQSKPSLWCADQTSWLDFRLYHHSLVWWAGLGWSILVPASTAAPITAVRLHHQGNSCWPSCSDSTCLPWWSRAWLCSSLETFKNTLLEITRSSSCLWPD